MATTPYATDRRTPVIVTVDELDIPPFRPHRFLRNPHSQTVVAFFSPVRLYSSAARSRIVDLPDGDRIVVHDDTPFDWLVGDPVALLIHGLAGCHGSPYMRRVAGKLNGAGVRTFRMDLRGCGAGVGLARHPYHAGRSEDAACVLEAIADWAPGSRAALIGFSLGGNIALKLAGERPDSTPANLDRVVAVSPPIDLLECVRYLTRPAGRVYDRYFVRLLQDRLEDRVPPGSSPRIAKRALRGVYEFDDAFTAPVCGFAAAEEYYALCSAKRFLPAIRLPTLVLAARDDPLVPAAPLESARVSANVRVVITDHGGHVAFIGRSGFDPDRRWMDWRIVDWVTRRLGAALE